MEISVRTTELSLVDAIVYRFAHALLSNARFKSLFTATLRRRGRSTFFDEVVQALTWFSEAIRDHGQGSLERATAWMLHGCRTAIALRLCETLSPPMQALDALVSSFSSDLDALQPQRLERFLTRNFAILRQYSSGSLAVSRSTSHDHQVPVDSDHPDDAQGPPDLIIFSDFRLTEKLLNSGPAFEDAYRRIKSEIFPSPRTLIHRVLRRHMLDDGQPKSIACVIDWRVCEYLKAESITANNIGSIFTINGELDSACVSRLEDYVTATWTTGPTLMNSLKAFITDLSTAIPSKSANDSICIESGDILISVLPSVTGSKEQALAKVSGSFSQICEYIEQLAWLAATLRPHLEGQLTVSDIDFNVLELIESTTSQTLYAPSIFHLSLLAADKTLQPDVSIPGQCWTSVCSESVLAHGFPLLRRRPKDAIGLEIPFEITAAFAGVRYPLLLDDGVVFANRSSALIPQTQLGVDAVQWHFVRSENWIESLVDRYSKTQYPRLHTLNASALTKSRSFLGYCKNSEVLLGTAEFEHLDVADSGVSGMSGAEFHLSENVLRVITDMTGHTTTSDGVKWKFNSGESALIHASDLNPEERCLQSARCSTLLYDQNSRTAFLMSELSLVLQLTTVYLREHSRMKRMHIPLADVTADGADSALRVFKQAKHQVISFTKGPSRRYSEVFEDFLDTVEQRKIQTAIRVRYGGMISKAGLKGWDHSDLQAKKFELRERELQVGEREIQPLWWDVFQESKPLVVFTRLPKPPIRSIKNDSEDGTFICRAWDDLPHGKDLLLISVPQLEHMKTDTCPNPRKYPTRYMLGDSIAWARPTTSRLFEHNCLEGGSCKPLQTMVDMTSQRRRLPQGWVDETAYHHHPGDLASEGAILFADDPELFQTRQCWRNARSRLSSRKDWNYPFIGVSVVVLALAYWNFWFFVMVLLLFGLAYILK